MTSKNNTKKRRREEKKLSHTVLTLASMIDTIATSMKGDVDRGDEFDLRKLKELTGAAKELSALISATECRDADGERDSSVAIVFEEEGAEWAG